MRGLEVFILLISDGVNSWSLQATVKRNVYPSLSFTGDLNFSVDGGW